MRKYPFVILIATAVLLLALALVGQANADTYTYDALGRLIVVVYTDGSTITYAYDDAGNRTTVTQTAAP